MGWFLSPKLVIIGDYKYAIREIGFMPICHQQKFIFFHIPRCGGTSVESFFSLQSLSFADYLQFAELVMQGERYFERRHYDHFRPMRDYCLHDDKLMVDDILLLENIDEEFERIRPIIGQVQLLKKNSSSPDYDYLRTRSNTDMVEKLYAADKEFYDRVKAAKDESEYPFKNLMCM